MDILSEIPLVTRSWIFHEIPCGLLSVVVPPMIALETSLGSSMNLSGVLKIQGFKDFIRDCFRDFFCDSLHSRFFLIRKGICKHFKRFKVKLITISNLLILLRLRLRRGLRLFETLLNPLKLPVQ